jgi:hypothetical protein
LTVPGSISAPARVRCPRRHAISACTSSSPIAVISLSLPKNWTSNESRFQIFRLAA